MDKIVIIGAGVAGINAATKLVDNNYPGHLITLIDMGNHPYDRKPEEVMEGFMGAGGWSDGKLTYHTSIGGHMSKYCGEEKAMELFDQVINNFKRFHPKPEVIQCSNPIKEPDFIKPHFGLRLFPVYHIGTDYLHEIAKNWYDYLISKGVNFEWNAKVNKIDFEKNKVWFTDVGNSAKNWIGKCFYDKLIFAVGKSGIDFSKQLLTENSLAVEPKPVQIGVRFEAPQKHFQKLIDISYDFKLYRKFEDKGVSLRTFCTNNNAAYVAVEETYGDYSYNGHAKKDERYQNDMTNFGILMEIKGIEEPFKWARDLVSKVQANAHETEDHAWGSGRCGVFYSNSRKPSYTSEGNYVTTYKINDTGLEKVKEAFQGYFQYIEDFIEDMKKIFPTLEDDWGIYIPEVKYLTPEPLVNYEDLSLKTQKNVHFIGDALSARGITVSGAQGTYVAESLLKNIKPEPLGVWGEPADDDDFSRHI